MDVVFLLDLDNTLIDNDLARDRLADATERILGTALARRYWETYEEVRADFGYVDTLETLSRFHARHEEVDGAALDRAILDFPYGDVRYAETLTVLDALWTFGTPVVLSDGDPIFQPLKVARSGVEVAVRGNVLVFTHKDEHLADVARLFPAEQYVAVDDRASILARIKDMWGPRVSTVHVLQGKYAGETGVEPTPDATIAGIGDLGPLAGTADALAVLLQETRARRRST